MTGGNKSTRVHYNTNDEDFIVIVESAEQVEKFKKDSSTPLIQVVQAFQVFTTNKHGAQGTLDTPSNAILDASFGTTVVEDILPIILKNGTAQTGKFAESHSSTNDSIGSKGAHGVGQGR